MNNRRAFYAGAAGTLLWLSGCVQSATAPLPRADAGATSDAAVEGSGAAPSSAGAGPVPFNPNLTAVDASPTLSDCSDAASALVYVLSNNDDLYSFAPDRKTFAKIGS